MSLQIKKVNRNSAPEKECIIFETKSKEKINLIDFVVSIMPFDKNLEYDNIFENSYRFPSCLVNKNDTIFLYSGEGKNSANKSGTSVEGDFRHITLYRNSKNRYINNNGDKVILAKFEVIKVSTVL